MSQLTIPQRNAIYQALSDDGVDLNDPYLNVRNAYTQFLEKRVSTLTDTIEQIDYERQTTERVNLILLLMAFVFIGAFIIWGVCRYV